MNFLLENDFQYFAILKNFDLQMFVKNCAPMYFQYFYIDIKTIYEEFYFLRILTIGE